MNRNLVEKVLRTKKQLAKMKAQVAINHMAYPDRKSRSRKIISPREALVRLLSRTP